jgi:hypothetical protein
MSSRALGKGRTELKADIVICEPKSTIRGSLDVSQSYGSPRPVRGIAYYEVNRKGRHIARDHSQQVRQCSLFRNLHRLFEIIFKFIILMYQHLFGLFCSSVCSLTTHSAPRSQQLMQRHKINTIWNPDWSIHITMFINTPCSLVGKIGKCKAIPITGLGGLYDCWVVKNPTFSRQSAQRWR